MHGVFQQRHLGDAVTAGLALLVLSVGIFMISVVSLFLSKQRQHAALRVIDRLGAIVLGLRGWRERLEAIPSVMELHAK